MMELSLQQASPSTGTLIPAENHCYFAAQDWSLNRDEKSILSTMKHIVIQFQPLNPPNRLSFVQRHQSSLTKLLDARYSTQYRASFGKAPPTRLP